MSQKKNANSGMPSPIAALLKDFLDKQSSLKPISKELRIWECWDASVGAEISRHAKPQYFRNGILFVGTKHAMWTTELQYRAHQIRAKLNEALGENLIQEIQFRLSPGTAD